MSAPLSEPVNGAAIRALFAAYTERHCRPTAFACCSAHAVADTVPDLLAERAALLAEVERLRSENRSHVQHIASLLTSLNREETRVTELETALAAAGLCGASATDRNGVALTCCKPVRHLIQGDPWHGMVPATHGGAL